MVDSDEPSVTALVGLTKYLSRQVSDQSKEVKQQKKIFCKEVKEVHGKWHKLSPGQTGKVADVSKQLIQVMEKPFLDAASLVTDILTDLVISPNLDVLKRNPNMLLSYLKLLEQRLAEGQAAQVWMNFQLCIHKHPSEFTATLLKGKGLSRLAKLVCSACQAAKAAAGGVFEVVVLQCACQRSLRDALAADAKHLKLLLQVLQAGASDAAALGLVICTQPCGIQAKKRLVELVNTKGALVKLVDLARSGLPATPCVSEVSAEQAGAAGTSASEEAERPEEAHGSPGAQDVGRAAPAEQAAGTSVAQLQDIPRSSIIAALVMLERLAADPLVQKQLVKLDALAMFVEWTDRGEDVGALLSMCILIAVFEAGPDLTHKMQSADLATCLTAVLGRSNHITQKFAIFGLLGLDNREMSGILPACLQPHKGLARGMPAFPEALIHALLGKPPVAQLRVPSPLGNCWVPRKPWGEAGLRDRAEIAAILIKRLARDQGGAKALAEAGVGSAIRKCGLHMQDLLEAYSSLLANVTTPSPGLPDLVHVDVVPWLAKMCERSSDSPQYDNAMESTAVQVIAALLLKGNEDVRLAIQTQTLTALLLKMLTQQTAAPVAARRAALQSLPYYRETVWKMDHSRSLLLINSVLSPDVGVCGGAVFLQSLLVHRPAWGRELVRTEADLAANPDFPCERIVRRLKDLIVPAGVDWGKLETFWDEKEDRRKDAEMVSSLLKAWPQVQCANFHPRVVCMRCIALFLGLC